MNIFVLSTGRCGSTTFIKACGHISNFSSAHESKSGLLGDDRLNYSQFHIEADNRLVWFLGKLETYFGNNAKYVHLKRDTLGTAKSYASRKFKYGILPAYRNGILLRLEKDYTQLEVAKDYCDTVNNNIEYYLKDKTHKMSFEITNYNEDFERFWQFISAEGDYQKALKEFATNYNSSSAVGGRKDKSSFLIRKGKKIARILQKSPEFIKNA